MRRKLYPPLLILTVLALASSCASLDIASYASDAFQRESDPALAAASMPTMMKVTEILLATDPGSPAKKLSTASLYVMYANLFLDGEAFFLPEDRFDERAALRSRANALYLRAAAMLVPLVEKRAPGFFASLDDPAKALGAFRKKDVPLLYWTAASVLAAFASDPMDFDNAARVSGALALFEKARALDPEWNGGALHELAITLYASLPSALGGDMDKAKAAYASALASTNGASPGPFVSYASAVCVATGDAEGFRAALEAALALPAVEARALQDTLARKKARRLLADMVLYF